MLKHSQYIIPQDMIISFSTIKHSYSDNLINQNELHKIKFGVPRQPLFKVCIFIAKSFQSFG